MNLLSSLWLSTYHFLFCSVVTKHGLDETQWQEIEHSLLESNGKSHARISYKRQLAAFFGVSALTLLRGVEACPPLFDSLIVGISLPCINIRYLMPNSLLCMFICTQNHLYSRMWSLPFNRSSSEQLLELSEQSQLSRQSLITSVPSSPAALYLMQRPFGSPMPWNNLKVMRATAQSMITPAHQ